MRTAFFTLFLLWVCLPLSAWSAEGSQREQRTFVVHCYDVGIRVLKDRPGIHEVKRRWEGLEETNIVTFDPQRVSEQDIKKWLRESGTFIRTFDP